MSLGLVQGRDNRHSRPASAGIPGCWAQGFAARFHSHAHFMFQVNQRNVFEPARASSQAIASRRRECAPAADQRAPAKSDYILRRHDVIPVFALAADRSAEAFYAFR